MRMEVEHLTELVCAMYTTHSVLSKEEIRELMDKTDEVNRLHYPVQMSNMGFVTEIVSKLPWKTSVP